MLFSQLARGTVSLGDDANRPPAGMTGAPSVAGRDDPVTQSDDETQSIAHEVPTKNHREIHSPRTQRWWFTMGWGLLILVTFFTGATAIIIFSRRFRDFLRSESATPTPSEDLWAMHKPPPIDENVFEEFEKGRDAADPIEFGDGVDEELDDDDDGFPHDDSCDEPPGS